MMVTINEDELVGYILRKISDDHLLDYEEVQAVLDSEQAFLKSKGSIEEREVAGVYINEGWLNKEVMSLHVVGVGLFHNIGRESITHDEEENEFVYKSHSSLKRDHHRRSKNSIVDNKVHDFKLLYSDTTTIIGKLVFSSVESDKFVMQITSQC